MRQKILHEVFETTQNAVRCLQNIVDCKNCNITCTDWICLMAVLQKTGTCVDYISSADLNEALGMTFGGHEVPIDDPILRAMLITSLVCQSVMVVDAISDKGQQIIRTAMCPPSVMAPLAQNTMRYLETVIAEVRTKFQRIADSMNEAGSRSLYPVGGDEQSIEL